MNDQHDAFLTQEKFEELKAELEHLKTVRRKEVAESLEYARSLGDLSENAEYHAAREELSFIDGRIDELEELLKQVVIIEGTKGDIIALGSKVTLKVNGKDEAFSLVGEWEADPRAKKISHESPLGKALLGKAVGEKVEVTAPAGKITYTIVSVS